MLSLIFMATKTKKVASCLETQSTIKIFKLRPFYSPSISPNNVPTCNSNHATSAKSKCPQKIKMKIYQNKVAPESLYINGPTLHIATPYKLEYLKMSKWMIKVLKDMEKSFIIQPSIRSLEKGCLQASMR